MASMVVNTDAANFKCCVSFRIGGHAKDLSFTWREQCNDGWKDVPQVYLNYCNVMKKPPS